MVGRYANTTPLEGAERLVKQPKHETFAGKWKTLMGFKLKRVVCGFGPGSKLERRVTT